MKRIITLLLLYPTASISGNCLSQLCCHFRQRATGIAIHATLFTTADDKPVSSDVEYYVFEEMGIKLQDSKEANNNTDEINRVTIGAVSLDQAEKQATIEYNVRVGRFTIPLTQSVTIPFNGDATVKVNETLSIQISAPYSFGK